MLLAFIGLEYLETIILWLQRFYDFGIVDTIHEANILENMWVIGLDKAINFHRFKGISLIWRIGLVND